MAGNERAARPGGWADWLAEGERILWEGRPDPGFRLPGTQLAIALVGLAFAGFGIFAAVATPEEEGDLWMIGLFQVLSGLAIAGIALWWDTFRRRRTWYALSNRRAFIATDLPLQGRKLASWPILRDTPLEYVEGPPASVFFATETRHRPKGGSTVIRHGFERIAEGREVLALMRDVQRGAA